MYDTFNQSFPGCLTNHTTVFVDQCQGDVISEVAPVITTIHQKHEQQLSCSNLIGCCQWGSQIIRRHIHLEEMYLKTWSLLMNQLTRHLTDVQMDLEYIDSSIMSLSSTGAVRG